jgi:4-hydroxy-3-polyprenylbenzoate decarboxylase
MYADLDDFLADLDARGLLTRVGEPVSPDLEIAAVTDRACKMPGGGPALVFEKPTGFDIPVASNVFGSLERMCLALGVKTLDDLATEIDDLMTPRMPAGIVDALKLLPTFSRLKDLMPKTVKDARRVAGSHVLARGRRPVHHVAARVHQGSGNRRPEHRYLPHAGL